MKHDARPDVAPIEWHRLLPRVQAHGLCRYCESKAVAMRKSATGWLIVCAKHRRPEVGINGGPGQ